MNLAIATGASLSFLKPSPQLWSKVRYGCHPHHCGGLRRVRRCNVVELVELRSKCGLDLLGIRRMSWFLRVRIPYAQTVNASRILRRTILNRRVPVHDGRAFRSLREGRFVT
jgi:hypothetical protein